MNRSIRVTMHGAVSVVNAVANGRGSALGISLKVIADLTLSPGKGVYLQSKQGEKLLNILIRKTLPKTVLFRSFSPNRDQIRNSCWIWIEEL